MRIELPTSGKTVPIPKKSWLFLKNLIHTTSVVGAICENCGTELFAQWENYKLNHNSVSSVDPLFTAYLKYNNINMQAAQASIIQYSTTDPVGKDYNDCISWAREKNHSNLIEREQMFPHSLIRNASKKDLVCSVVCPICNSKIKDALSRSCEINRWENFDEKLNALFLDLNNSEIKALDEETALVKTNDLITTYSKELPDNVFQKERIIEMKESPDNLKDFLLQLIKLEANIYSVSERIKNLYSILPNCQRSVTQSRLNLEKEIQENLVTYEAEIRSKERELSTVDSLPSADFGLVPPKKPEQPSKPILKTPGMFNKKKIAEENESALAEYDLKMQHYQESLHTYEIDYNTFREQVEKERIKRKKKISLDLHEAQINLSNAKSVAEEGFASQLNSSPSILKQELVQAEIKEARDILQNLVHMRTAYYTTDIVFMKYQNMVAISTFYEYLASGRCSTLEGANGAYNIYEQEIRLDCIVSKLDDVLVALDRIEQNQYMLYSVLENINMNLQDLSSKTDAIVNSLENIENTTARIEYNTAETAFYAKKNAELTDALGLMLALK